MQRAIIFSFVVALAYASVHIREESFRPNREFVYKYESQVLSGIPGTSKQYSGLKLRCFVKLQFKNEGQVLMKLDEIQLGKLNTKLQPLEHPEKQVAWEKFQPLDHQERQVILQELVKPVKFQYNMGEVRDVRVQREEPEWSLDIKRGILNVFQLSLNKEHYYSSQDKMSNDYPASSYDNAKKTSFKVKEDSTHGLCKTLYTVQSLPQYEKYTVVEPSQQVLNVTKVRSFSDCEEYPILVKASLNVLNCTDCDSQEEEAYKALTHTKYNLIGNKRNFVIEKAVSKSQYTLTPYKVEEGSIITYVRQTLKLERAQETQREIEHMTNTKHITLRSGSLDENKETYSQNQQTREIKIKQKVLSILRSVKEDIFMQNSLPKTTPSKLIHVVSHLKHATQEELLEIYEETKREDPELKKLFLDCLPMLGSKAAVKIIRHEIEQNRISKAHGVQLLLQLSFSPNKDDRHAIDETQEMCKSEEVQRSQQLKKMCWMAYGNMIYHTCVKPTENKQRYQQQQQQYQRQQQYQQYQQDEQQKYQYQQYQQQEYKQQQQEYQKEEYQTFQKCSSEKLEQYRKVLAYGLTSPRKSDQLMSISAISNAGLENSVSDLFNVINDKQKKTVVRLNAIYALHRIAKQHPRKVEQRLLAVYMNSEEHFELRIAALNTMLIHCRPHKAVLQTIAHQTTQEPHKQVQAYTFNILKTLANTTTPCFKRLGKDCKHVLQLAKPIRGSIELSDTVQIPLLPKKIRDQMQVFPTYSAQMIASNTSVIPRVLHNSVDISAFGKLFRLFDMGVRTKGMESLLESIYKNDYSEMLAAFGRHPRNIESRLDRESDDISEKLRLQQRLTEEPSLSFWISLFGTKIESMHIDQENFQQLLSSDLLAKIMREEPIDISFTKAIPVMFADRVIPTEMGIPLRMHLSSAVVVKNRGTIKTKLDMDSSLLRLPKKLEAEIEMHPSIVAQLTCNMTVKLANVESGVAITSTSKVHYPVQGKIHVDIEKKTLRTEFVPNNREREIFFFESKPITFVKMSPFTQLTKKSECKNVQESQWEMTMHGDDIQQEKKTERTIPVEMLNTQYRVEVLTQPRLPSSPKYPLSGKYSVRVVEKPISQTPEKVEIKIQYQKLWESSEEILPVSFEMSQQEETSPEQYKQREQSRIQDSSLWSTFGRLFGYTNQQQQLSEQETERDYELFEEQPKWEQRQQHQRRHQKQQQQWGQRFTSMNEWQQQEQQEQEQQQQWNENQEQQQQQQQQQTEESIPSFSETKRITHQLKIQLRNRGVSRPMQWVSVLKYTCSADKTKHQLEIKSQTTKDQEVTQMILNGYMKYSRRSHQSWEQDYEQSEQGMESFLNIQWGRDGESKINMEARTVKSRQQIREEQNREIERTVEFQQCQKDQQTSGNKYSPACRLVNKMKQMHRQIQMQIQYENVPFWVKQLSSETLRMFQYQQYSRVNVQDIDVRNKERTVEIIANIQKNNRIVDILVKCPRQNILFNKIQLPFSLKPVVSTHYNQLRTYVNMLTGYETQSRQENTCHLWNDEVETFDRVPVNVESLSKDCYHVLAKDCSERNIFSVLVAKQQDNQKKIKIYTEGKKIEIIPREFDEQEIYVRGEKKNVRTNEQIQVRDRQTQQLVAVIMRLSRKEVKVVLPQKMITVHTDGKNVDVKTSYQTRSRMCGICGNFDGETTNEFSGPQWESYERDEHFLSSYLFPSEQCQRLPQTEVTQPRRRTVVRERQDQICFSLIPVQKCRRSDLTRDSESRQVPFHCLPKHLESTQILKERALSGESLHQFEYKSEDMTDYVQVAKACSRQ